MSKYAHIGFLGEEVGRHLWIRLGHYFAFLYAADPCQLISFLQAQQSKTEEVGKLLKHFCLSHRLHPQLLLADNQNLPAESFLDLTIPATSQPSVPTNDASISNYNFPISHHSLLHDRAGFTTPDLSGQPSPLNSRPTTPSHLLMHNSPSIVSPLSQQQDTTAQSSSIVCLNDILRWYYGEIGKPHPITIQNPNPNMSLLMAEVLMERYLRHEVTQIYESTNKKLMALSQTRAGHESLVHPNSSMSS